MFRNRLKTPIIGLAISSILMLLMVLSTSGPAFADSCTDGVSGSCSFTLTGGSEGNTPSNPTLGITDSLNGLDQTLSIGLPVDVSDQDGLGWHVTLKVTSFTGTNLTLSDASTLTIGMAGYCDTNSTCTLPDGNTGSTSSSSHTFSGFSTFTPGSSTQSLISTSTSSATGCDGNPSDHCYNGMGKMLLTTTLTANLLAKDTYPDSYTSNVTLAVAAGP